MMRPLLCLVLMVAVAAESAGSVKHYKFQVNYDFWSPDCVQKLVISINGQFPGPTIRATQGDIISVEVENVMSTEQVVIHWHGVHQRGTPWYDGAAGVSQCAVGPGETFVYEFAADKAGTFFYHGHMGLQRSEGMYGLLIVEEAKGVQEPFQYDGELSIALSDWWHESAIDQSRGLFSNPFQWVNEPQSLLMGGRGQYNCSLISGDAVQQAASDRPACNTTVDQCAPFVFPVQPGQTYRLRIVSVTSLSYLNFQIEGHKMTVVEADGNYVEPVEVKTLNIHSGESYSVLVSTFKEPPNGQKSFWAVTYVRGRPPQTPPGKAILFYGNDKVPPLPTSPLPPSPAPWNDTAFSLGQSRLFLGRQGWAPGPPQASEQQVILLNTQNYVDGVIKWAINNISWALPSTPLLAALKLGLRGAYLRSPAPTTYDLRSYDIYNFSANTNALRETRLYRFRLHSVVDFVLQNAIMLPPTNDSGIHPWHMHGHSFWVLGYGPGKFDPGLDPRSFNLINPPLRNTVPLYPFGWTAIRFVADNPGVWPFHCHLEPHMHMGMAIIFAAGVKHVGTIPQSALGCGLTKRMLPQ